MFCKQCGNLFQEGDRFCRNCGHYQVKRSVESPVFEPAHIEYISRKKPYVIEIGVVGFRIIASLFVAGMLFLCIVGLIANPELADPADERFAYKWAMAIVVFFAFLLPSIFILLWSFRAKIPFLQHLKNGHIVLIIAGMMLLGGLGAVLIGSLGDHERILAETDVSNETTVADTQDPSAVITPTEVQIVETVKETTAPTAIVWPEDFQSALSEIGIDTSVISEFTPKDDWAGGMSYAFYYKNTPLIVCCNSDETVESIALGDLVIYRRGYEPLLADDYIVDSDSKSVLQSNAAQDVTAQLATPEFADFPMRGWGIGHCGDIYFVTGVVSAQDAGGEKRDMSFRAEYEKDGDAYILEYLVLDGADAVGSGSRMEIPEAKPLASEG